jgi:hypothetical protein
MQEPVGEDWKRYGRAVIESMREVLAESPDEVRSLLLETADYWLSVGLVIGLRQPADAELLLKLMQQDHIEESGELESDGATLCADVLG